MKKNSKKAGQKKKVYQKKEPKYKGPVFKKKKVKKIEPSPLMKTFKFMGYCKCGCLIGKSDLETKFIYVCPNCGKRARVSKLVKQKDKVILSRKEYMETINSEHLEMPYIAKEDVPPEILKKFEEDD